jgi:citrate lyase subunit beta/citryl-CoA lyase
MTQSGKLALGRGGEAGRRGKEVRSDLWVRVEPRTEGGLELVCQSKVDLYYGESIRAQVRAACERMGLRHGRVELEDAGAVPFVIDARVECALRRALGEEAPPLEPAPGSAARREPGPRIRLRRSRLYLPGNEPKFMLSAALHGPDAIILDLEDSVAPAEKDAARLVVRNALRELDFGAAERMVRLNQLPLGLDDLNAIVPETPDLLLLPKCESPEQVAAVDERATALRRRLGLPGELWLMPILESPLGIERAYAIATASPRVVALTIGLEDYTAELGAPRTKEGTESFFARQAMVNAARAAGVVPIDSVYSDVADAEGLRVSACEARALGFEGKGCIHPGQIRVVNEAFAPTAKELDYAVKVVAAFEEASRRGLGVVSLGTKMIDAPVVRRAQRIVEAARALGLLAPEAAASGEGRDLL